MTQISHYNLHNPEDNEVTSSKYRKKNNLSTQNSVSFKNEAKYCFEQQKLREFIASTPVLKEKLKTYVSGRTIIRET